MVIRRMRDTEDDYALMIRWRNSPHVRYWWDPDLPPLTLESAREEYLADTLPDPDTTACIVELAGEPVGFMQFYRWSSYADEAEEIGIEFDGATAGVDVFVGEPDLAGQGLGTRMMNLLCGYLETERDASSVVLTTELTNEAAIRCYEKAGFKKAGQIL
ncbi:MAG: aminoglycoside 6-N-acetyltransferase, partial [Actinomycetota bacterium]|nr:aminoglycoside 6-N-acetyltransferase [Actinomycetota bacterium]